VIPVILMILMILATEDIRPPLKPAAPSPPPPTQRWRQRQRQRQTENPVVGCVAGVGPMERGADMTWVGNGGEACRTSAAGATLSRQGSATAGTLVARALPGRRRHDTHRQPRAPLSHERCRGSGMATGVGFRVDRCRQGVAGATLSRQGSRGSLQPSSCGRRRDDGAATGVGNHRHGCRTGEAGATVCRAG
jgi:hypothetical protein